MKNIDFDEKTRRNINNNVTSNKIKHVNPEKKPLNADITFHTKLINNLSKEANPISTKLVKNR